MLTALRAQTLIVDIKVTQTLTLRLLISALNESIRHELTLAISPAPNFVASVVPIKQTKISQTAPLLSPVLFQVLYSQTLIQVLIQTASREKKPKTLVLFQPNPRTAQSITTLAVLDDLTKSQIQI